MGNGGGDFFLPLLLLDIVKKNSTTRDVLNAVVYPRKQLGMTVVLGAFVLYIFSFFIFYYFRNEIDIEDDGADEDRIDFCANLYDCFKTVTSFGMRSPEGMGGFMDHDLDERWILDFLYFVVVLIVLLNVIFGIIIDTFSDLRSKKEERLSDTAEVCFICGIDKQVFDRASDKPNGFQEHIKKDHNMWAYYYFIVFIWEQDKDDDDGMELYVRNCIDDNDLSWFPMNKAMRLDVGDDDSDELINAVKDELDTASSSLAEKLEMLKTEMSGSLEQLSVAVAQLSGGKQTSRGLRRSQSAGGTQSQGGSMAFDLPAIDALHIQIQEVSGVNLSSDNLSKAAVTIKSDVGVVNVEADRVSGSKILFAPEAFVVGDGRGTPGSVTLTFEAGPISGSFVLASDELDTQGSTENRVMKTFALDGQQALAKIVLVVSRK
jgi:inositol 1,4,5-triphosphate receptor type 3